MPMLLLRCGGVQYTSPRPSPKSVSKERGRVLGPRRRRSVCEIGQCCGRMWRTMRRPQTRLAQSILVDHASLTACIAEQLLDLKILCPVRVHTLRSTCTRCCRHCLCHGRLPRSQWPKPNDSTQVIARNATSQKPHTQSRINPVCASAGPRSNRPRSNRGGGTLQEIWARHAVPCFERMGYGRMAKHWDFLPRLVEPKGP